MGGRAATEVELEMENSGQLIGQKVGELLDQLVARTGLSFLRLHGDGVDVRIVHVGRGQCFVIDHARKVRDRIGERLVRWGHLDRQTLLALLKDAEERNRVLDFTTHVAASTVEYVAMSQALDSLDRTVLFPHLSFQIGEQTEAYRGCKLSASSIKKRIDWANQQKKSYLKWRGHLESGRLRFNCGFTGRSPAHEAVEVAIAKQTSWDGIQSRLHEPLFRIALQLDGLEQEGAVEMMDPVESDVPTVLKSRWVFAQNLFAIFILAGVIYAGKADLQILDKKLGSMSTDLQGLALAAHTFATVSYELERYQERFGEYPSDKKLRVLMRRDRDVAGRAFQFAPYRYLGFKHDYLLEVGESVGAKR